MENSFDDQATIDALRAAQPAWKKDGFGIKGPQLPEQHREPSRFGDVATGSAQAEQIPPH